MKPSRTRILSEQLRPLSLSTDALARVAGGESASTSTSGTPVAGDDTIGDHRPIPTEWFTLNYNKT